MRLVRVPFLFVFAFGARWLKVHRKVCKTLRQILRFAATFRSANTLVTLFTSAMLINDPLCLGNQTSHLQVQVMSRVDVHFVHEDVGRSFQVRLGASL